MLRLDGEPLQHVTLRINDQSTTTDSTGRLLLPVRESTGRTELLIDGPSGRNGVCAPPPGGPSCRRSPRCPREGNRGTVLGMVPVGIVVSRRFDGWVGASVGFAAASGPLRRWRPHPSNPLLRRRAPLALDERGYKADGTSRDQRPTVHWS